MTSDLCGNCPSCGRTFTKATAVYDRGAFPPAPKPGDFTLCVTCNTILTWDPDFILQVAVDPPAEIKMLQSQHRDRLKELL